MSTYEIFNSYGDLFSIKRINDDGSESWIPFDEANADYQAYLAWLAEQPTLKAGK
jgi:hypothetical protein